MMNNSILDATPNNLQHFMLMVVHQVQQQEDAWPFLHAVTVEEVPDYHDIIKVSPCLSAPDSACHCRTFMSDSVQNRCLCIRGQVVLLLGLSILPHLDSDMAGFAIKPSRPPVHVHLMGDPVNTRMCKGCLLMVAGLVAV